MNEAEHKAGHEELYRNLNKLVIDYIAYGPGGTANTIRQLLVWARNQAKKPDHVSVGYKELEILIESELEKEKAKNEDQI